MSLGSDVETLLAPVSAEQPAGPDLEYDAVFAALERAAQGKPEQHMGAVVTAAEPPDWKQAGKLAEELLARTKDLRVACLLAKAKLHLEGLVGLADGLSLLRGLVERFWDGVHPALDPEDGNDPTMRLTALMGICDADTLTAVRNAPLVSSRMMGRFSLRDIALATNELTLPPGSTEKAPQMSTIDGAFSNAGPAAVAATTEAVRRALTDTAEIEAQVLERVGGAKAIDLSKLSALLAQALRVLSKHGGNGASAAAAGPGGDPAASSGGALSNGHGHGEIGSRDDVVRALDRICAYFDRHEPSSPVPLLMKRARRLVTMDFLAIVKDLAPEALAQVESLAGRAPSAGDGGEASES